MSSHWFSLNPKEYPRSMPKKTDKIVDPIDASFDDVAEKMIEGAAPNPNKLNALQKVVSGKGATIEKQLSTAHLTALSSNTPLQMTLASPEGVFVPPAASQEALRAS